MQASTNTQRTQEAHSRYKNTQNATIYRIRIIQKQNKNKKYKTKTETEH